MPRPEPPPRPAVTVKACKMKPRPENISFLSLQADRPPASVAGGVQELLLPGPGQQEPHGVRGLVVPGVCGVCGVPPVSPSRYGVVASVGRCELGRFPSCPSSSPTGCFPCWVWGFPCFWGLCPAVTRAALGLAVGDVLGTDQNSSACGFFSENRLAAGRAGPRSSKSARGGESLLLRLHPGLLGALAFSGCDSGPVSSPPLPPQGGSVPGCSPQ